MQRRERKAAEREAAIEMYPRPRKKEAASNAKKVMDISCMPLIQWRGVNATGAAINRIEAAEAAISPSPSRRASRNTIQPFAACSRSDTRWYGHA